MILCGHKYMPADNTAVRKAYASSVGLGCFAMFVGLCMVLLGLVGGDGTSPATDWLFQGVVAFVAGGIMVYYGRKIMIDEPSAIRSIRVLTWLAYLNLTLSALSIAIGDYTVIVALLLNLLLISYYRAAKRSFVTR